MENNKLEKPTCSCLWCLYEWHCDWKQEKNGHCPKFKPDLTCAFDNKEKFNENSSVF